MDPLVSQSKRAGECACNQNGDRGGYNLPRLFSHQDFSHQDSDRQPLEKFPMGKNRILVVVVNLDP